MKKDMKKDMKKNAKKNSQNGAQKAKIALDQELVNEIKTYHRAHNRLVNKLITLSDNPTFILATLHAVHAISMKYEQDTVCMPDNGSVWAVTSDGTSHGDYENGASTTLFATESDALDFVRAELVDQIINGFFTGKSPTKEEIEREVAAHCTWFGEHEAQFRDGDAIADYKIEKMSLPRKAQKGE